MIFLLHTLPAARRSAAVGWFTAALSVGGSIAFLCTPALEDAVGWRGVFVLYGAVAMVGGALVLFGARHERGVHLTGPAVGCGRCCASGACWSSPARSSSAWPRPTAR